jgi:uncharacterized membrane protein (DUF2068 family)
VLRLIALFRWSKALIIFATALGAMRLLHPGAARALSQWAMQLPFAGQHRFVSEAIARVTHLDTTRIEWIVAGLCAYGALFTVEGFGLWLGKRWGEWLTIVATTSFIPFEIYELWRRATIMRAALLAANVAIVIYLVWRVRNENAVARMEWPPSARRP